MPADCQTDASPFAADAFPRCEGTRLVHAKEPRELGPLQTCEHGVPWDVACRFCELRQAPCEG